MHEPDVANVAGTLEVPVPASERRVNTGPVAHVVEGLVLAAGAGRRLRPHTDRLPKTLVPLADGSTVLERILKNFRANDVRAASIVVGYCAEAVSSRLDALEAATGLRLSLIHNDHAEDRNNAYSLWCAREVLARGALLVNGDTLHSSAVQQRLLAGPAPMSIRLAIDDRKRLGDEEMKVTLDSGGLLVDISKSLPHDSSGEYIGVAVVPRTAAGQLIEALERVWLADDSQFYEAAFRELARNGCSIEARSIGVTDWIEIDSGDDLLRANELICRS